MGSFAAKVAAALVAVALGFAAWGVAPIQTLRFVLAALVVAWLPGWVLLHPARGRLDPVERAVLAPILGGLAFGVVHYLWNIWVDGRPRLPGSTAVVVALASAFGLAAVMLAWRGRNEPRSVSSVRVWMLALAMGSTLPGVLIASTPNGRATEAGIESDKDEFLHWALVGEFLRPGPVEVPWMVGHPMAPYEFLAPATEAAFVRVSRVDPLAVSTRFLPVALLALAGGVGFLLARRLLGDETAAVIAAMSLAWSGEPFTLWGFVLQLHSAMAYLAVAAGVLLLEVGTRTESGPRIRGARICMLACAAFLFATVFQLKTPLYLTLAWAMIVTTVVTFARSRRVAPFWVGVGMVLVTAVLGIDYLASASGSPLVVEPGGGYARLFGEAPEPFAALSRRPLLALALGSTIVLLGAINLKLVGLPWLIRCVRERARPGAGGTFLIAAVVFGLFFLGSVSTPAHPTSIVPFWFLQIPLMLCSQLMVGAGIAAWLSRPGRLARRARIGLVLAPGGFALVLLGAIVGAEPVLFPASEVECAAWLLAETEPDEAVLIPEEALGVPVLSLRQTVYTHVNIFQGDKANEIAPPQFLETVLSEARERRAAVQRFYTSPDPAEVLGIARRYGATHFYLGPHDDMGISAPEVFGPPATTCGEGGVLYTIAPP